MSGMNVNKDAARAYNINGSQRLAAGVLGMDVNKLNDSVGQVAQQKYSAGKPASTSSAAAVRNAVSDESKNINGVYEQIKKSGDKNAEEGFRKSIVSFAKNGDAAGLKNFVQAGTEMQKNGNGADLNKVLSVSNSISNNTSGAASEKFVNEAMATYKKAGASSMSNYTDAAASINSKGGSGGQDAAARAEAMNNLNKTFEAVRGQKDASSSQIAAQMADISKKVQGMGSLGEANKYMTGVISGLTTSGAKAS